MEKKMIDYLEQVRKKLNTASNFFAADARLSRTDSMLKKTTNPSEMMNLNFRKAHALLEAGKEKESVDLYNNLAIAVKNIPEARKVIYPALGLAYMRLAERTNCLKNHSADACIMPIEGGGIHKDKQPAEKAIEAFEMALKENPSDLDCRWLLNIAYMVTGNYPSKVPAAWLIPGLDAKKYNNIQPFRDIAMDLGVDVSTLAGGMIADDFNNDGYKDILYTCGDNADYSSNVLKSYHGVYIFLNDGHNNFSQKYFFFFFF
jgi:tetratricopeptide (TPR) repeat protein